MKTSQNNTRLIEKYLFRMLSPVDRFVFEARLALNPGLKKEVFAQEKIYRILKMYHREQLKEELEILHRQIFSDPSKTNFQQTIYQIFK